MNMSGFVVLFVLKLYNQPPFNTMRQFKWLTFISCRPVFDRLLMKKLSKVTFFLVTYVLIYFTENNYLFLILSMESKY